MNIKKIFLMFLIFSIGIVSVYAQTCSTDPNDYIFYDHNINGTGWTNIGIGTTYVNNTIIMTANNGGAYANFTPTTNEVVTTIYTFRDLSTSPSANMGLLMNGLNEATDAGIFFRDDHVANKWSYFDGTWHSNGTKTTNTWYEIKIVNNLTSDSGPIFVDDVSVFADANFRTAQTQFDRVYFKRIDSTQNVFITNVSVFNGSTCPTGVGPSPIITIENNTVSDFFTFNSTLNRYYTQTNLTLTTNLSVTNTNSNVNGTYNLLYLNNNTLVHNNTQYMTNSLNGELLIDLPYEGLYKFNTTYFNNETNVTDSEFFISSDITPPNINLSFPEEINLNNETIDFINFISINETVFSCTAEVQEFGQSIQNLGNCSTASYIFTKLGNASIIINATDLSGNINSSIAIINIDLFRINMTFFSQFSGLPLDQVTVYESTLGLIGSTGSDTNLTVFLNPDNYTFTAVKTSFVNTTLNFTKDNVTPSQNLMFNMSSIFSFYLADERTLGEWNISATDLVTLQIVCADQQVIQSVVNSTNFSVDVPCEISKFKFIIDYTSDSYFRSILIDETERMRTVYLIDLTTTQSVFNTFTLFDLTSIYQNPRLSFKKFVGTESLEITGDVIDAEGKVPAYLILNDEYILELSSDNLPTRSLGFYSADVPGDKVIKLFDLAFSQSATTKNGKVFMTSYIQNSTLFGTFNDTTGTTSLVTFTVQNVTKYGNILFQDTIAGSSVGGFSYSIPTTLENLTLYTTLDLENSVDDYLDVRAHRQNNELDLGLINLTNIDQDWVITVLLGFLALTLTISTASVGALIMMAVAALLVTFGWFKLSWFTIVLGLLLSIIKIVKEEEKK